MGQVVSNLSMSLDGFIEDANGSVERVFAIAQAKAVAGDKDVSIASPSIAQQALNAGLLDVITVDLAPVLLGAGTPYFARLASTPVRLDDPEIRPGSRVTHLRYRVLR